MISSWSSWSGGTACTGGQTCSNGSCTTGGCTNATTPGTPVATAGNSQCTITENDAGTGYSYRIKQGTTGTWQNKSSHTFTGLTNDTTYSFYIQRKNTSGSCTSWSSSASASCTPASASSCSATTKNGCELATTAHNGTSGSCASDYTGTCSYTCNNGSWTKSSNSCSSCSVASVDWCESSGYSVSLLQRGSSDTYDTYDLYDIGECASPASLDALDAGVLGSYNYCISPSLVDNRTTRYSCGLSKTGINIYGYYDSCVGQNQPSYCTVGDTVSSGDYAKWVCKCGNQEQVCESYVFYGGCANSGNGCNSGRDELVECAEPGDYGYSHDGYDRYLNYIGPPNGPSGGWSCAGSINSTAGINCNPSTYPQATGICCTSGYRCNGSVLQQYEKCQPTTQAGTTCSHGCWDPSSSDWKYGGEKLTDSKCHACATDSDCQCTGDNAGKTPKCEAGSDGFKDCKCKDTRSER